MIDDAEAEIRSARENLARIKKDLQVRDDVCIREDPLTEMISRSGTAGQRYAAGQLCIVAGSSVLRITAESDAYIVEGTDCGRDWARPNTPDATRREQVTLDVGGEAMVVSASAIETLLSAALFTRWRYEPTEDGSGGHQWLRDYVDGWLEGHA